MSRHRRAEVCPICMGSRPDDRMTCGTKFCVRMLRARTRATTMRRKRWLALIPAGTLTAAEWAAQAPTITGEMREAQGW